MCKLKIFLFISLILTSSCSHYDVGDLIDGYKVIAMNPQEIYVERPDGVLIAGPNLKGVAIHNDKVFTVSEFNGVSGSIIFKYGVIYTSQGIEKMGMSDVEFFEELKLIGSEYPIFNNPSKFFTRRSN